MSRRGVILIVSLPLLAVVVWFVGKTTTRSSAENPVVSVRINGGIEVSIERGEPVAIEVFIGGRSESSSLKVGTAGTPWPRLVSLLLGDNQRLPGAEVISPPRTIISARDSTGRPEVTEDDGSVLIIDGRRRLHVVEFGLSPEITTTLPLGPQTVTAMLEDASRWSWNWRGTSTSVPVRLVVKDTTAGGELQRLERAGRFYVRAGQYDRAQQMAQELLAREPADAAAQILLGDAFKGLGKMLDARAAYLEALRAVQAGRRFNEEPESLFTRIREVERELVAKRR